MNVYAILKIKIDLKFTIISFLTLYTCTIFNFFSIAFEAIWNSNIHIFCFKKIYMYIYTQNEEHDEKEKNLFRKIYKETETAEEIKKNNIIERKIREL